MTALSRPSSTGCTAHDKPGQKQNKTTTEITAKYAKHANAEADVDRGLTHHKERKEMQKFSQVC
jgi:hypothetical protein